ncbi:hypothetical protein BN938_0497 [Mucinivorans hirudinis]|uniref:Uncharacterized protein n=1 Tax=Mucinivorans hirudinis TaxID=1433126 RepID=A0A060R5U6_9BACT|nr:hypothetical protein BN938_0108 [Mucinivorans hirudinis]CDN30391.1 hypothetical protein BN938_0285 [Mucinivorans hirudinis]CDN30602.1 hypothetical protein BN938_0497 [Mucinivorans hirudinis]
MIEQSAYIPAQQAMFTADPRGEYSEKVRGYIEKFWSQIKDSGKIDSARASYDEADGKSKSAKTRLSKALVHTSCAPT